MERVSVTGIGLRTCLGSSAEECWRRVAAGVSGLSPIQRFPLGDYPVVEGGEIPGERGGGAAWELDQIACVAEEACGGAVPPGEGALVLGSSLAGSSAAEAFFRSYLERGPAEADYTVLEGYYVETGLAALARRIGTSGPSLLLSNACAAGGSAIARGASLVRSGRAPWALCIGYDPLSIFTFAGFGSLMALTRSRVRPFDSCRDGMLLGDGFAAVLLEPEAHAARRRRRPLAHLLGKGESTDAHHLTHPHPEGSGAAVAMRRALESAHTQPDEIDYVNCHGTATRPNDAAEARGMRAVFGERLSRLPVSSLKPFCGHTLGGAGGVDAVLTILALERQFLPPTLNLGDPDPDLGALDLVPRGRPATLQKAMSNNFGFGGSNVSLVFERASGEEA